MHSRVVLVAAVLATALAEPIPRPADDKKDDKKDDPSPVIVLVGKEALTTTFEPPATCTESRLTMLVDQEFYIWNNEPMPNDKTKIKDCFPSQFIDGYTSIKGASSSIAPLMSPLVCPKGWTTAQKWDNGYIACCMSNYRYTPPKTTVDTDRPAFGGTCYSDIKMGHMTTVTQWNGTQPRATQEWSASATNVQAFGHIIDGFALDLMSATSAVTSSTETQPAMTSGPADPSTDGDNESSSSSSISGGAIAGIVIGALAGVAIIIGAAFFFVRRRAQKQGHEQIGTSRDQPSQQGNNIDYDTKPLPDVYPMKDHPSESVTSPGATTWTGADGRSEVTMAASPPTTLASPVSELGGLQRHELASTDYVELDSNQSRHEMRA